MERVMTIPMRVDISPALNFSIQTPNVLCFGIDMAVNVDGVPYAGQTVVIPSAFQQSLPTAGTLLTTDITVEPIPSNYGLITWNGSTLTVS